MVGKERKELAKQYLDVFLGIFKYSATIGVLYPIYDDNFSFKRLFIGSLILILLFIITVLLNKFKD
jgi:hypothetical protein